MPYSITTKDGITINGIPDDMPADHPDLKARVATIRGGKPAAAAKPAVEDPGVMGAATIGAGRTADSILDGLTQWLLQAKGETSALGGLKQNVDEKAAIYKPLQEQHPYATAMGEALPSMAIPVGGAAGVGGNLLRLGAAGALPGALEYGTAGERFGRAATGAAAGVIGGVVAPKVVSAVTSAVPAIGRTAKAIVEPLYEGGRQQIAGRALNAAAGQDAAAAATRMAGAAPAVAGSLPTAAQVAENGGIAALERSVASRQPADFTQRAMEQSAARLQALRGIAGDDAAMAAAQGVRKSVSEPLYNAAKAQTVAADPRLIELMGRPSVQKAIARAQALAAEQGRPFALELGDAANPGKVTGQALQDIKMGLDALLKDPASGIVGAEANSVKATRGQLMNWMEQAIPELKVARSTYAGLSKPINQMQIGQELVQRLEPALGEHGALGSETGAKYALALRNADQTARAATGFKGAGMADIMEPGQMQALQGVATDLARKANSQNLGRGPGSNTFQNFAMDNIAGQSGAPRVLGAAMNFPGVSKVAKFAYSGPEEKIQSLIAQALLDPVNGAALMGRNAATRTPQTLQQMLLSNPSRAAQIAGGTAGLTLGNLFAQ